jgi:hypothetical protein
MAYTIIRSDNSTVLTTIQDGTINTTSTSLGLPGRNYAGYGRNIDTNFVRMLENFANDTPPANPLKGQLWFNTITNTLCICPSDGMTIAANWIALTSASSSGDTVLGNVNVTGSLISGNLSANSALSSDTFTTRLANIATLTTNLATVTTANLAVTNTRLISTGLNTNQGNLQGSWIVNGNPSGNALAITNGNVAFPQGGTANVGIKCDYYMYANGTPFNPTGTYTNATVSTYLTDTNPLTGFRGNIFPSSVTTSALKGGGTISGVWTLDTNARINATYADLAERYEADAEYEIGTVVALGGDKEVTIAPELSEQVFGVVSNTYAYLMNEGAGTDATHPAIALAGRVKVKVTGPVAKHARLVSAGNGLARAATEGELTAFNSIGRALEDKSSEEVGIIEAVVVIK